MNNKSLVLGLIVGLVIGLPIGILTSKFVMPSSPEGTNNQVQVSGTVRNTQTGTIYFLQLARFNDKEEIKSSSSIVNGKYSVWLVGNQSYDIFVNRYPTYSDEEPEYTVYVPAGVTTFTANF